MAFDAMEPVLLEMTSPSDRPPKERLRVSRACDSCKKKKTRCTGRQPCQLCTRDGIVCEFKTPNMRGKRRSKSDANLSSNMIATLSPISSGASEILSHSYLPAATPDGRFPSSPTPQGAVQPNIAADFSGRTSPEPGDSVQQGYFVGSSSGLSFLLRLQRRLRRDTEDLETSVFTLGDPVLGEFDELSFSPPPRYEAEMLLKTYFELASPTYRFLHRPTVERWIHQLYENGTILGPQSHSKYAVILAMFAQATRYGDKIETLDFHRGVRYFQAAERELSRETESPTLTSVQASLSCCFFVLTCSRLNHCWSLFGTTSRLIIALGLHRKRPIFDTGAAASRDLIDSECRKRLFWCAFTLDKYLSAIFGRPCVLNDDDTDQEMPSLVDDKDLTLDSMTVASKENLNVMLGPLHHQKLGRILSKALRKLYGIKPLDRKDQLRIMDELGAEVDSWRSELPAFLDPNQVDSTLLRPLFQRQSNLLTLASCHADILIFRPCLMYDYAPNAVAKGSTGVDGKIQRCLDAAMSIVGIIGRMVEAGQFYAASWFAHYQAFIAVVVLHTYTLRCRTSDASTWLKYFRAAERCQTTLASVTITQSLAKRFSVIMEEFRLEVVKRLQQDSPSPHFPLPELSSGTQEGLNPAPAGMPPATGASTWTKAAGYGDIPSFIGFPQWDQLDSLAMDLGDFVPDIGMFCQDPSLGG